MRRIVKFGTPVEIVLNPLNQYAADFVAHMNPVGVLKAKSIVSPIENVRIGEGSYRLDVSNIEMSVAADGSLKQTTRD